MIQNIEPAQFNLNYSNHQPAPGDTIILFRSNQIMLTKEKQYPLYQDLCNISTLTSCQYLFQISEQKYFLAFPEEGSTLPLELYPLRILRTLRPMHLAFAGYTAWHLYNWYQSNRFCGCCGALMRPGDDERRLDCTECHNRVYPRINPCIIVAVHDKERLLMTRYRDRPVTWFVLIAGFVEVGETAEDTVRREVMEEAGVKVKNIRYFSSQPWGIPGNLTLGFTAELDGSDQITLDTNELSEGRWFTRDEVPVPEDDLSITAELIRCFVTKKF